MQTTWSHKVSDFDPPESDRSASALVRTAWSLHCAVDVAIPRTVLWDAWWLDGEPVSHVSNVSRGVS